jgi:hypothetical protein
MKKLTVISFCILVVFMFSNALLAQRIVNISPTEFGILNKTIDGDTTATGERVDLNTVYVLERGPNSYYVMDGAIENRYPLTIVAADGDGERPKLVPGVVEGGESDRPFVPRGDLTLKGLYITNKDQAGGLNKNTLRIKASDVKITAEDCHFDYDSQSTFRLDDDGISLFLNGCIVSNVGQTVNPNNGRGIDDRGNNVDSLVVENCTFYNLTSRALRDGGGFIKYAKFNHNTFSNIGQMMLSVGEVVEFEFTNNQVVNGLFLGNSVNDDDPSTMVELEPITNDDLAGMTQMVKIQNNNFYVDETIVTAYPDSVVQAASFDSLGLVYLNEAGNAGTILNEAIMLPNGPAVPVDVMLGIYNDNQSATDPAAPPFDEGGPAFGEAGYGVVPFGFDYSTETSSATASTGAQPLGDLNWFDMEIVAPAAVRYVPVAPTEFGILNKMIDGDTTATGERINLNTVYVLERGPLAYYLLDGAIENRFPLTIVAADGDGERPKLVPGVVEGGESDRPFVPRADLTLKGLYVTNKDQAGGLNKNTLRIKASDVKIVAEDCHFDYDSQSTFRLDDDGISVILKNSVISNIGQTVNPNNGRGIDDRGNNVNAIIAENCTFYNITSRVLRDGGGYIKYARFNHNTFCNIGQMMLTVGEVVDFKFTNNMVVNGLFLGNSVNAEDPNEMVELEPLTNDDLAGLTQKIEIQKNNFYVDLAVQSSYPDSIVAAAPLDSLGMAFATAAGTEGTNIDEAIAFTAGPTIPTDVMLGIYADNQSATDPSAPPFDEGGAAFGEAGYGVVPFDFSYTDIAISYVYSTAQQPLGALNWFGMDISTSVEPNAQLVDNMPQAFNLVGNYPNPFNPTTNIVFELSQPGDVDLAVYNVMGQKVKILVNGFRASGHHVIGWNGLSDNGTQMSSGVYFYRLETQDGFSKTMKMILMK